MSTAQQQAEPIPDFSVSDVQRLIADRIRNAADDTERHAWVLLDSRVNAVVAQRGWTSTLLTPAWVLVFYLSG